MYGSQDQKLALALRKSLKKNQAVSSLLGRGLGINHSTTLETTNGQIDGFFSHLPFECYLLEVATVGD